MSFAWQRGALHPAAILAVISALALAGCQTNGQPSASLSSPRGASVAFDSIDGMPRGVFDTLVQRLNDEAQTRPLAIASREEPSAYRVKGYVSAVRTRGQASIVWAFDVYDSAQNRAIRLTGEEKTAGKFKNAWAAADDAMLRRVARNSLDQLAAFLSKQPSEGDASANALASSAYDDSPRS